MEYNLDNMLSKYVRSKSEWTPVDEALYKYKDNLNVDPKLASELRFNAIKYAFTLHYNKNENYFSYCKMMGISPKDLEREDDLFKIPLIPDHVFKEHPNDISLFPKWFSTGCSIPLDFSSLSNKAFKNYDKFMEYAEKCGLHITFSTNTSGKFSFVGRDEITMNRLCYNLVRPILSGFPYNNIEELDPFNPKIVRVIGTLPNPKNSSHYFFMNLAKSFLGNDSIFPDSIFSIKISSF